MGFLRGFFFCNTWKFFSYTCERQCQPKILIYENDICESIVNIQKRKLFTLVANEIIRVSLTLHVYYVKMQVCEVLCIFSVCFLEILTKYTEKKLILLLCTVR